MATDEVIVAIALGLPSLVVAVLALWVAYLTFQHSRLASAHNHPHTPRRVPSWPAPDPWVMALPPVPAADYQLPTFPGQIRQRF